jgi:hypothetical protein
MRAIILWNILCLLPPPRCNMRFHANPFEKNRRKHRDRREHSRESGARRRRDCQNRRRCAVLRPGPPTGGLRRNPAQQSAGGDPAKHPIAQIDASQKIGCRAGNGSVLDYFVIVGRRKLWGLFQSHLRGDCDHYPKPRLK